MSQITLNTYSATGIAETTKPVQKLPLIEKLIKAFHEGGISYCHWKSNAHLDASMTGDTDLDVLFDIKQKKELEQLLKEIGFKKFDSIRQKQYKDIEDFIGIDLTVGKVIHLHTHYRLTMGEVYLKGYQLNLEEKILNSCVYDNTFGIYVINPAFELVLLYFREALKIRNRDIARMYLKNKVNYSGNTLNEYNWLKKRSTDQEVAAILHSIVTNYQPIYKLVTGKFDRMQLLKLSGLLRNEFRAYRLFSPAKALMLRWYREVSVKIYKKTALLLNSPIVSKRINPRGGLVIAVIGADGSGKSTVTADLQSTFKTKLDVYRIYFGRGDGRVSWSRKILSGLKKIWVPAKPGQLKSRSEKDFSKKKKGFIANIYKCLVALLVANEKRKNLKLMQAAKKKGMLVICDRFPQNQVMGYNDGPMLYYLAKSRNPIFRAVAKMEAGVYARAEKNPPDVVFKLIANAKVVESRKPGEVALEMLEAKIAGTKNLKFSEKCNVITVDAVQPLETVLRTVKKGIWDAYL